MLKQIFIASFFVLFSSTNIMALTFEFEKSEVVARDLEHVKNVILAVEDTCSSGCTYKLDGLIRMKVLEQPSENEMTVWRHYSGLKEVKEFAHYTYKSEKGGKAATIEVRMPSKQQRIQLTKDHGLVHNTLFDDVKVDWRLETVEATGQTLVSYKFFGTTDSFWMKLAASKVNKEIRKSTEQSFGHFRQ